MRGPRGAKKIRFALKLNAVNGQLSRLDATTLLDEAPVVTESQLPSIIDQITPSDLDILTPQANKPKWETDDGRVVQRIWQHQVHMSNASRSDCALWLRMNFLHACFGLQGCFDIGSTFLLDKLKPSTGRLIAVIDENVDRLYVLLRVY